MTDPSDRDLRDRLARLSAAVPVDEAPAAATGSGRVVGGPVVWSQASPGRLVAATVAVVVLAMAAWGGLIGRFGASSSPDAAPRSVVSDGMFELALSASRSRYGPSEPIVVSATLRYLGGDAALTIFHGLGADDGPVTFAVDEPVRLSDGGLVRISGLFRDACRSSVIRPGSTLSVPFAKSGGNVVGSPSPGSDVLAAFFKDPGLRLPAGTWHLEALANLSLGGCGGERHQLRTSITVTVDDEGSTAASQRADPETVSPSPSRGSATAFPEACPGLGVSLNQCAAFAAWAVGQAGVLPGHVNRIDMARLDCPGTSACPSDGTGYLVNVHVVGDDGSATDERVDCTRAPMSLGGISSLCDAMFNAETGQRIQYPIVHSAISGGYRDTPCSGEAPVGCATPLPSIDPSAREGARPLAIGSREIPIDHAGPYAIVLGEASLPNGILSAASAEITSSPADPLVGYDGYELEVTSLDGGRPFDNYYAHGWQPGTERVEVTLRFTVLTFEPGATVVISGVDVH